MDLRLNGKRALVCGSTQGIGRASAMELAELGASVILLARNPSKLEQVLKELPAQHGQQHSFQVADFGDPEQVKRTAQWVATQGPVHILINNTGGPPGGPALSANTTEFVTAFSNHLLCNHHLVQALVPGMKSERYGRIINVISTSVKVPIRGLGVSNTIRGAVANWSKTLSLELAPFGITVNNVLPGASMTGRLEAIIRDRAEKQKKTEEEITRDMVMEIPAGRISSPEEVAAAVAFLATPAAGYINGVNIPVDGGRTGSL
ncbi:MAG TPA: SDR family oxidoreductase [Cyclobacteriaceae bacterium]|nr:SDR family oxidoreductase [Cyclobacteriaceae bacterium]